MYKRQTNYCLEMHINGEYPGDYMRYLKERNIVPKMEEGDAEILKSAKIDYIALNYYRTICASYLPADEEHPVGSRVFRGNEVDFAQYGYLSLLHIFYEAYKEVPTPLGSCYLANFRTMRRPALAFGPNSEGDYLYFWLTGDGNLGYIGYSFLTSMIKKRITEPLHPLNEDFGTNAAAYICYHSDIMLMQKGLQKSMEHLDVYKRQMPLE